MKNVKTILFASLIATIILTFSAMDLAHAGEVKTHSEYTPPKKQLDSGVSAEDVTCRDGKILVLRANGDVACVTERTAQKVGWEIIVQKVLEPVIEETIKEPVITDAIEEKPLQALTNSGSSSVSPPVSQPIEPEIDEKIVIWTPIPEEDHENMSKIFLKALGDEIDEDKEENKKYQNKFYGKKGILTMDIPDESNYVPLFSPINYISYDTCFDNEQRKQYVFDFMDIMGFKYDKKDLKISTLSEDKSILKFHDRINYISFTFDIDNIGCFNYMEFNQYSNKDLTDWEFEYSSEEALEKAKLLFPSGITEPCYFIQYDDKDSIFLQFTENPESLFLVDKIIYRGSPYYAIDIGYCQIPPEDYGIIDKRLGIFIDATDGENWFYKIATR